MKRIMRKSMSIVEKVMTVCLLFGIFLALLVSCSKDADEGIIIPGPDYTVTALKSASSRRVDVLMIGGSNQLKDGTGYDHGFGKALGEKYGYFATQLFRTGDRSAMGYLCSNDGMIGQSTGLPSELDVLDLHGYLKGGVFNTPFNGIGIRKDCPLNVNSNLRFHYAYGTFTDGDGSFEFGVRHGEAPWTLLKKKPVMPTNTGGYNFVRDYIDLEAASRNVDLEAKWYLPGNSNIIAPFVSYYIRCEDLDKNNGISVSTLFADGTASLYDMAHWFINQPDKYLINYFSEIRNLQRINQEKPIVIVYINSGYNDMTETASPSLSRGKVKNPTSAEAYVDNLDALINRISSVWGKTGWSTSELYFWVVPSHPESNPDNSKLVSYRQAAYKYCAARGNIGFFDISQHITADEISSKGYYLGDATDRKHLTQAGYEYISQIIVDQYTK